MRKLGYTLLILGASANEIPEVVSQLQQSAKNGNFAVLMFVPSGSEDGAAVNLQYSIEGGVVGFDWVLIGSRNVADKAKVIEIAPKLGYRLEEHEGNNVHYLRMVGSGISELGLKIIEDIYKIDPNIKLEMITEGFTWQPLRGADILHDYHIRFGIIEGDKVGSYILAKETTIIPYKFRETGFRFGYEIVSPVHGSYFCQYVVHLPSSPDVITGGLAQVNAVNPSSTITSHKKEIAGGTYVDAMWFDPGDPVGDCSIDIFVNGELLKTIKFSVTK
jgi:hypothetical protein